MGKIETTLKNEMARIARREIRTMIDPLQKQIRQLTRQVRALSAEADRLSRRTKKLAPAAKAPLAEIAVSEAESASARISPGLIKKIRKRFTITQHQLAALVGVSAAAVQSWEQGIARPTGSNRVALISLRQMNVPDVAKLLSDKGIAAAKRRPRTEMKKAAAEKAPEKAKKAE